MKEKDKQLREKVETSIFIIGNGFDLTLGLKTKYIDFFENKISPFNVRSIKKYIFYERDALRRPFLLRIAGDKGRWANSYKVKIFKWRLYLWTKN